MASLESGHKAAEAAAAAQQFDLPVDSECKATTIKIYSVGKPHMRAFHLAWISFFMTFIATFAPAALMPVIREDLSLTSVSVGLSGVLATLGAIVGRMGMGTLLDVLGPRYSNAIIMLMFAPPVFLMSMVKGAGGFECVRFFIGISLCCFVACQFWVGSMFNVRIVGTANAIAAGWGNMGGGVTQILMPAIYQGIYNGGVASFTAWRWAFFVPGGIFLLMGMLTFMTAVDSPLGDYRDLKKSGVLAKGKGSAWSVIKVAATNYRAWVLFLTYGYSFGVELAVDNVIVQYFYDQFGLSLVTAGGLGALFGLMNFFSRATGGLISDLTAARFGMRGRLWTLWTLQTLGGVFCIVLAYVDYSLGATIAVMIIFSIFCQQACGATYGVVPFVSRRAYGVVSGIVGAGGNVGAVVTQVIFFAGSQYSPVLTTQNGFKWMGVMILGMTLVVMTIHFPMWGSMFFPGNEEVTEEDYYLKEWSADEVAMGLHHQALKFAMESRSQRGFKADGSMRGALSSTRGKSGNATGNAEVKVLAGGPSGDMSGSEGSSDPNGTASTHRESATPPTTTTTVAAATA